MGLLYLYLYVLPYCGNIWCSQTYTTNDKIVRRVRIAFWVTKATDTRSGCVILLFLVATVIMVTRTLLLVTFLPMLPVMSESASLTIFTSRNLQNIILCLYLRWLYLSLNSPQQYFLFSLCPSSGIDWKITVFHICRYISSDLLSTCQVLPTDRKGWLQVREEIRTSLVIV